MHNLYANIAPFYIRDLSISGFWYLGGSWKQSLVGTKGQLHIFCMPILWEVG